MNADAYDVARARLSRVEPFQRLVDESWLPVLVWRRRGEHVQPARSNDANTEGDRAGIYEEDCHRLRSFQRRASAGEILRIRFLGGHGHNEEPAELRDAQDSPASLPQNGATLIPPF